MPIHRWALVMAGLWLGGTLADHVPAATPFQRSGVSYAIDVWDTEDGLPQNSVISIIQARDGYLWLGTLNGLVRFDGNRFSVYDESNTPELGSSRIVSLFEDTSSALWVGTETGGAALVRDGKTISLNIGRGRREGRVMAVCEDADGAVWLYTAEGELCRHRDGKMNVWRIGAGLYSRCRALISEHSGPLWLGTDWRLFAIGSTAGLNARDLPIQEEVLVQKLDFLLSSRRGGHWRLAEGHVQKWNGNRLESDWGEYPWGGAPVSAACEDREGNLLVGTLGAGVYWYAAAGKPVCLSTSQGLSHNHVLSLCMDREGSLWVGTDGGGLNRVRRQVFDVLPEAAGLTVQSVCEAAQGGVWIGLNAVGERASGAGLLQEGVLRLFGPGEGLLNSSVWSVFVDDTQRLWAGTWGGLFAWQDDRFQRVAGLEAVRSVVQAIHQDSAGRLWLGTRQGLLGREGTAWKLFSRNDGLSADVVRALSSDAEGSLWVGTEGGGLNRLRDGKFTSFCREDALPSKIVASLLTDAEGVLWVGTDGGGLARMHGGQWTRYTTRDGLLSNSVGYLLEDGQGHLWLGSNAGLMRVSKKALNDFAQGVTTAVSCRVYGKADGLPTRECTLGSQPGACRTRDGRLWFPTVKGLASVDTSRLSPNLSPPPVVIETVLIDGLPQTASSLRGRLPSQFTIPAGKERLEIQYTSLNLSAPDRARFRYRLEGYESAWTEAGSLRVAHYPKLPPGEYRFQVKACNEDGVWNETGSSIALVLLPPFWKTSWFLFTSTLGLLAAIVATVHFLSTQRLQRQLAKMRQQEALEKERARIARDIHDQLGASLTQVSLLGELVETDRDFPEEVTAHARQISQTARETTRTLDEIVWTVNPSNDTLEGLVTYLCKYAQDYLTTAGLRYRLEVPAPLPAITIPPEVRHNVFLATKEAITNVVRHAQATAAKVRLQLEPRQFSLEIQDDGRGPGGMESKQERNGLRNMRRRMEDIGGVFAVEAAPEKGTVVRLTVPLGDSQPGGRSVFSRVSGSPDAMSP